MKKQLLYKELAEYYDLIYSSKRYKKEADKLFKLISKYKKTKGNELLEVACGTGHHLKCFEARFSCTGIDISEKMLSIAKKRVPKARLHIGNMINFKLKEKFDVITCLFSSIGYVKNYQNLRKTIKNFSKHLKDGGVLLIEPWFTKKTFRPGMPYIEVYRSKKLKIARASVSRLEGNLSIVDMHHLIAEKDKGVRHYVDRHELALFEIKPTLKIMCEAGLKPVFLKNGLMKGRGLYVGVKE